VATFLEIYLIPYTALEHPAPAVSEVDSSARW